jgi:hypothetical protein
MKRIPELDLPFSRASLPEGCSDLIDAYEIRSVTREDRSRFLPRLSAVLHDPLVDQLDLNRASLVPGLELFVPGERVLAAGDDPSAYHQRGNLHRLRIQRRGARAASWAGRITTLDFQDGWTSRV